MIRRALSFSLLVAGIAATSFATEAPRPNILYLYVDDMGWGSIGPNGQAERKKKGLPFVKTPNLDRLAAAGVNFTRGYGCHVCSPARSSQQSGFHQGHTFADRNDPDNAKKAMRRDDILMGDVLAQAGYATGYWGKWGYGGSKDMDSPSLDNLQTLPTSHGYQHVVAELHHVRAHTFFQPTLWTAPAPEGTKGGLHLTPNSMAPWAGKKEYPDSPAWQNDPKYPEIAYCDDVYAFAALDFVRRQAQAYTKDGTPFFGLFAAQIPHAPFDEVAKLPKWNADYAKVKGFAKHPKQSQQWAAMVTRIDAHFGHLIDALEDPNGDGDKSDSVADNTLVVFQSDNGGPGGTNNPTFNANGGLRGTKNTIWEGGIRVPLIMRWPSKIHDSSKLRVGESSDFIVDVTDLLPTFSELAGWDAPLGVDGVSIAPLLSGNGIQRKRDFLIHEAGKGTSSIIAGNHKLIRDKAGKFALYDLIADHGEEDDIAARNPKLVKKLSALLLAERVTEPVGFSNTYHYWDRTAGEGIAKADQWTDYVYENAGITYQTDDGPPQLSWCARMVNSDKDTATAKADADISVLALDIGGSVGFQILEVGEDRNVTGRNEIRVSVNGKLHLAGGSVSSIRWIDIGRAGTLAGHGTIHSDLYLGDEGSFSPSGEGITVKGKAHLDGKLLAAKAKVGVILRAESIEGRFQNDNHEVQNTDGKTFQIQYGEKEVSLVAK